MNADTAEGTYRGMAALLAMAAGRTGAHGEPWTRLLSGSLRDEENSAGTERPVLSICFLSTKAKVPHTLPPVFSRDVGDHRTFLWLSIQPTHLAVKISGIPHLAKIEARCGAPGEFLKLTPDDGLGVRLVLPLS